MVKLLPQFLVALEQLPNGIDAFDQSLPEVLVIDSHLLLVAVEAVSVCELGGG